MEDWLWRTSLDQLLAVANDTGVNYGPAIRQQARSVLLSRASAAVSNPTSTLPPPRTNQLPPGLLVAGATSAYQQPAHGALLRGSGLGWEGQAGLFPLYMYPNSLRPLEYAAAAAAAAAAADAVTSNAAMGARPSQHTPAPYQHADRRIPHPYGSHGDASAVAQAAGSYGQQRAHGGMANTSWAIPVGQQAHAPGSGPVVNVAPDARYTPPAGSYFEASTAAAAAAAAVAGPQLLTERAHWCEQLQRSERPSGVDRRDDTAADAATGHARNAPFGEAYGTEKRSNNRDDRGGRGGRNVRSRQPARAGSTGRRAAPPNSPRRGDTAAAPRAAAVSGAAVTAAEDNTEHASPEMQAYYTALANQLGIDVKNSKEIQKLYQVSEGQSDVGRAYKTYENIAEYFKQF